MRKKKKYPPDPKSRSVSSPPKVCLQGRAPWNLEKLRALQRSQLWAPCHGRRTWEMPLRQKRNWEWAGLKNPNKWWVLCGRGERLLYLFLSPNLANWFIMALGRAMYRKTLHRLINLQREGCDLIDLWRLSQVCQTRWDLSQPQMMTWKTRRPLWTSTCSTTHLALFGFNSTISIQNVKTFQVRSFFFFWSWWWWSANVSTRRFHGLIYIYFHFLEIVVFISKGTVCAVNDRPAHTVYACLSMLVPALQLLHVSPACNSWQDCPHSSKLSSWVVGNYFSFHLVLGTSGMDIGVWLTDLRYLGEASEGTFVYWFITQWLQPLMCLDCVNVNLLSTNNFTNMALSLSGNQEVHKVDKRNLALDPLDSSSEQLLNRTKRVWTV